MEKKSESVPLNESNVISAEPISYVFPVAVVEPHEEQDEPSNVEHSLKRKRRDLSATDIENIWRASFRLLQCKGAHDTYILEMHEVETGNVTIHQLVVREEEVHVKVISHEQRIAPSPNVHIVNPLNVLRRSGLFLTERLAKWSIELRKHRDSERRDKFYIHDKVQRKFRSLQEVAIFILYNCYRDDLKNGKLETTPAREDMKENDQQTCVQDPS